MCASKAEQKDQAAAPRFSMDECRQIAAAYDGTPQSIDRLMAEWGPRKAALKRRHITRAAARGGYKPTTTRRPWSPDDNKWLLQHWSKLSDEELVATLQRPAGAIQQQYRRLRDGAPPLANPRFSLGALRTLTGVDPRDWRDFIRRGWLQAQQRQPDAQTRHPTYVTDDAVRALLQVHPEIYDYGRASDDARQALALGQLPTPPRFKLVTCRSRTCSRHAGTTFWAGIYEAPNCPRCGRLTSRLSETAQYRSELGPGTVAAAEWRQGTTGEQGGDAWSSMSTVPAASGTASASRPPAAVAVRLLLCEDQEHRLQVLRGMLAPHASVVIVVESQQEARSLKVRLAVPTARGSADEAEPRCIVAAGMDQAAVHLPHCVVSVDIRGTKALGRTMLKRLLALLDTRRTLYHAVVITREECRRGGDRFDKRLKALRARGTVVLEEADPSRCGGLSGRRVCPAHRAAIKPVDPLLVLLGWVGQGLKLTN
jgi:hypothetical protein